MQKLPRVFIWHIADDLPDVIAECVADEDRRSRFRSLSRVDESGREARESLADFPTLKPIHVLPVNVFIPGIAARRQLNGAMLLIARALLRIVTRPFERLSEIDPFEVNGDEMTALLGAVHDVASCWAIGAGLIISRALDAPGDPVEAALI